MAFSVVRATAEDIPGMTDIWYSSFNTPAFLSVFPDTPIVRNSWVAPIFAAMVDDPSTIIMLATEDSTSASRPRPVAYSIWRKHPGGPFNPDWRSRWPVPVVEGMSEELIGPGFFDPMFRQHVVAMEERPHYFLEVLGTHEAYQKKGLGSRLLKWGCEAADKEGLEMYLDAASKAVPLYERHGYIAQEYRDPKAPSTPMRRPGAVEGSSNGISIT